MSHSAEQTMSMTRPEGAVTLLIDGDQRNIACESCIVADTPFSRMRGLLGRGQLPNGEGILLQPASSIHTAFMRFPIDAVFLNRDLRVVGLRSDLSPWRTASCRRAKAVLELAAGEAERRGVRVGDRLLVVEAPPAIDVDLTALFERVGAMLSGEGASGQVGWHEIEALLTEGYAQALALESERLRIERRIAERTASRRRRKSAQTRSLITRHDEIDSDIRCLRALLAELYEYGRGVRDAPGSRAPVRRPSSQAA